MNQKELILNSLKEKLEARSLKVFLESLEVRSPDDLPFLILSEQDIEVMVVGDCWRNVFRVGMRLFSDSRDNLNEMLDLALEVLKARSGLKAVRSIEFEKDEGTEAMSATLNVEFIYSTPNFSI